MVHGTPEEWFKPYGWRICGTEEGSEWGPVTRSVLDAARGENPDKVPSMAWFKTRKGRGYLKYDNKSHGTAHPMNSEPFWTLRKQFMEKYGVEYDGVDGGAPKDPNAIREQARSNLEIAIGVLRADDALVTSVSDRLREIGRDVPDAPHETLLVLDSNTGQNALSQARLFTEVTDVTGLVLTKMDGTAKGGVIIGLADEFGIPVHYVGVGEGIEDLHDFSAQEFVDAIFEDGD